MIHIGEICSKSIGILDISADKSCDYSRLYVLEQATEGSFQSGKV